ncbi:unnamed protein product [Tilletia laevis]|uniref:Uncharacterized protein n=2 Tax=Tilletia TaxID=13289 RepID=A0A177UB18_9BASI|nr:hypothetical protein CF336_g4302 [Tilletia laevis]KAE8253126.1 hypothetical protein A4X03_0g5978 [Tilletia caries]KAE8194201.1 hypothetical protein CF335_g5402 [Tilletia laevis]CAD6893140.1 unnamed protein product [Tilletia caries]CAD6896113.1 unnamed protein product [Tilletia caries]
MPTVSRSTPSTSSSLTPLPSTPASRIEAVTQSTPSVSGSAGPRARGYPEGMFSTPSRKVVPVIVIPSSEPRHDEVSGISDGSTLSSLSASGRTTYKPMSPNKFTAAQKCRRVNESSSPLDRLGRPSTADDDDDDDDDDGGGGDGARSGSRSEAGSSADETIREAAKPARKRTRRTRESSSDEESDKAYTDSDDELPDLKPRSRAPNATRQQPQRAAVGEKTYQFDDKGNFVGSSKSQALFRPKTVAIAPATTRTPLTTAQNPKFSIAAMLRRKKEQARQGTDLAGMDEADALVRDADEREKREEQTEKQKAALEEERRVIEGWQKELDRNFLSPPSKKMSTAVYGDNAGASQASDTAQEKKAAKHSMASLNKRFAEKLEGGCTSDGLDEEDSSSDAELDSDNEGKDEDGERSTAATSLARIRLAEQKERLSGMTRTLKSAAIDGRDVLVDIIATDYGLKKEKKEDGGKRVGKSKVKQGSNAQEEVPGSMWMRGRVTLRQVSVPAELTVSPFGKLLFDATKDGPWTLAAALSQIRLMTPRFQVSAVELSFLLSVAIHGLDSRSSTALQSGARPAGWVSSAHPWSTARKERQAVASAACVALECVPSLVADHVRTAGALAQVDSVVKAWMVETLVGLGASTALLKRLRLLSSEVEATLQPVRSVREQERHELRRFYAQPGQSTTGLDVKREGGEENAIDPASLVGWLSLEERMEAITRLCSVVRSLCSRRLLSWTTRADLYLALAVLSATHAEDGLLPSIGDAMSALMDDGESAISDNVQQRQDEVAQSVFAAFEPWPIITYAAMLRGIPKDDIRSRALSRQVAWKLLDQRHQSLRRSGSENKPHAAAATTSDALILPGIALPNLSLLQDLITTSNDTSPFWISTTADDARQAAAEAKMAAKGPDEVAAACAASGSDGAAGPTRRVTDYPELLAWTEIVSVALDDLAVQATAFKEAPLRIQPVGDLPKHNNFPVFEQAAKLQREARASLILATRPFVSLASSRLSMDKGSAVGASLVPDGSRIRTLEKISLGLRSTFNKIYDYRGASLERSRAKDAIQRLHIRLHYLVPFYFANGSVGEELKLSEIYGKDGAKGLSDDSGSDAGSTFSV